MIQTDRLILRPVRDSDLEALFAIYSDPVAMAYWSRLPHTDRSETAKLIDGLRASHTETGCEYIIERDGAVIGKAGLWRVAEIGYILHPDHWRQGLMREALNALIPAAFAMHPSVQSIEAEIDSRNTASERLLLSLGFQETGRAEKTLLLGDLWTDSTYFKLPRPSEL